MTDIERQQCALMQSQQQQYSQAQIQNAFTWFDAVHDKAKTREVLDYEEALQELDKEFPGLRY